MTERDSDGVLSMADAVGVSDTDAVAVPKNVSDGDDTFVSDAVCTFETVGVTVRESVCVSLPVTLGSGVGDAVSDSVGEPEGEGDPGDRVTDVVLVKV